MKYYDYVYTMRAMMRMFVLENILQLLGDKDKCKFRASDIKGMETSHVGRCLGNLSKVLPLYMQLTPENLDVYWTFHKPTLLQIKEALNMARTGCDETDWNPEI